MKKFIKKFLIFLIISTICISILNEFKKIYAASAINIQNGSFEKKEISEISGASISDKGNYAITNSDNILNWKTTATDDKIEVGEIVDGKSVHMVTAYQPTNLKADGMQYAELNANEESSLYQNISTNNSSLYIWSIAHRGRGEEINVQDVIAVIIGNKQQYSPAKNSSGEDQYMLLVKWIYSTITKDNVLEIIKGKPKKKEDKFTGKLLKNIFKKYKDKFANDKEFSELIDFLLENQYKNLSDERRTK